MGLGAVLGCMRPEVWRLYMPMAPTVSGHKPSDGSIQGPQTKHMSLGQNSFYTAYHSRLFIILESVQARLGPTDVVSKTSSVSARVQQLDMVLHRRL